MAREPKDLCIGFAARQAGIVPLNALCLGPENVLQLWQSSAVTV